MSTFTTGPWDVEREHRDTFHYTSGHSTEPCAHLTVFMSDDDYAEVHGPNQEANAALLAAAPDMYEALKMAADYIGASSAPHRDKDLAKVFAALAKADGREG